jgi:hypothetical protein
MATEGYNKSLIDNVEYYIIKIVLIITTAIVGIAFLVFAGIHVWKFIRALLV